MQQYDVDNPDYQKVYRKAAQKVQARIGFYWHLTAYIAVNGFLILVYLLTGILPGFYNYPWFVWTMAGWGIGLIFHYFAIFQFGSHNTAEVRRQMIEEEMRRMGVSYPAPTTGQDSNSFPPSER